ncbi:MAG: cbb3-type cytochrome c oxidase subunit I, partial [Planctomycetes bacterium]|nr:cbb3-type cytochrome c oxidase subunit I [Planctomycetota bacterium]
YLIAVGISFFLGGFFALGLRIELWSPGETIMGADTYNQFFTLHGAVMVFLFIVPGIPAGLGNFFLPMMLGAPDVAFPRLNLASFYLWLFGAAFFIATLSTGGLDTGWTFYTPYSVTTNTSTVFALFGAFILGFSSIFTGINFIVTIHKMRPSGMGFFRMPLFLWGLYATAIIQVLATPVLGITLLLLILEKPWGIGIFDPGMGGDPVLFQHFFWFYSHPAVYLMILPAMAVISEVISTFCRKPIFGYTLVAYSSIMLAVFGSLVWGHHLFVSTQSDLTSVIFSALTFSVAIPSAIKVFNWLTTMYRADIRLDAPMWYAQCFIFLFLIGGLTGLFCATLSVDVHLHDTYFVVAHFHYVMVGSVMFAFMAGLNYWWPKMFSRMYNATGAKIACLISFVGFNLAFFPQFLMGARGMPRRYYDYAPAFESYHQLSTIGAVTLGIGMLYGVGNLLVTLLRPKEQIADNPWGGATLEWQTSSPPPLYNFEREIHVFDPYDMTTNEWDEASQGYVLTQEALAASAAAKAQRAGGAQ